jgi:hypothetical protein
MKPTRSSCSSLCAATLLLAGALMCGCGAAESHVSASSVNCTFAVSTNSYSNYWGTLTVKNSSSSSWSGFAVSFDVPSGAHCTNDAVPSGATLSPLTGSGMSAHTTSNHCVFTFTASLAAGASKTFNYSTDVASFSSAASVSVSSASCGSSGGGCALAVTQNSYDGPNYWGTIAIQNNGASAVSGYSVALDVPSGAHCTADTVPAGATLSPLSGGQTSANHCVFTWTSGSLAAGATLTFNYSTDSSSFTAASHVRAAVAAAAAAARAVAAARAAASDRAAAADRVAVAAPAAAAAAAATSPRGRSSRPFSRT